MTILCLYSNPAFVSNKVCNILTEYQEYMIRYERFAIYFYNMHLFRNIIGFTEVELNSISPTVPMDSANCPPGYFSMKRVPIESYGSPTYIEG